MGMGGAGAATCISNYIGFLYFLFQWNKRRKTTIVCLNIKNYQIRNGICAKTLAIGVPAGLVLLLTNICDFVRNYYLGKLGSDYELAAWGKKLTAFEETTLDAIENGVVADVEERLHLPETGLTIASSSTITTFIIPVPSVYSQIFHRRRLSGSLPFSICSR